MRAQGSAYEITKALLEAAVTPRPVGAEVTTFRGIAQAASTTNSPWEVQLSSGGFVRVSRKDAAATWGRGDEVILLRSGWSWTILDSLAT